MKAFFLRHLASILKSSRFRSNFFSQPRWWRALSPIVIAFTLMILYLWPLSPAIPAHADLADEFTFVGIRTKFSRSVDWGDMDGDGDLDLAIGNYGNQESNRVYRNDGDGEFVLAWESELSKRTSTTSVDWGDMDGDGDLDLAVGNEGQSNQVYRHDGFNENGDMNLIEAWSSPISRSTHSVAWGDVDGDGNLDLAVGNYGQVNEIYLNDGIILADTPTWTPMNAYSTTSVALGDMDGDGDLDLAVGNFNEVNQVYLNTGKTLGNTPAWSSTSPMSTRSVAWGDMDRNGTLDLAVGNDGQKNQVYRNSGTILENMPAWSTNESHNTHSVAWGDWDADGALDLAVGNWGQVNQVYTNTGSMLGDSPAWQSVGETRRTSSVAWADMDNDGDLDLAVDNHGQSNQVYHNQSLILGTTSLWTPTDSVSSTHSVAWGDIDGDGDLDLALGNWGRINQVYLNEAGTLAKTPVWSSRDAISTTSVAWGDMDADGDLDLAVGNANELNQVYRNDNGTLEQSAVWVSTGYLSYTTSVAWGDINGDGYLDLAVGNEGQANQVYLNQGGTLERSPSWHSNDVLKSRSIAWGDMDGDGDLDLAVGNYEQVNQVYLNDGGVLEKHATWESSGEQSTRSVAWGDVDGDGDLDLAVGNDEQVNQVYLNEGGILAHEHAWRSRDAKNSASVAWGDTDGDGDLDLAVGNYRDVNQVYRNVGGTLDSQPAWESTNDDQITATLSVAWADVDGDGDLELAVGNESPVNQLFENPRQRASSNMVPYLTVAAVHGAANADFYASSNILNDTTIPITYKLFDPSGEPLEQLAVFYSLNGGGDWLPAIPTTDTVTTNLTTSPNGVSHVFTWDTFASGFFGQSDNVVLRFVAHSQANNRTIGTYQYPNRVAGPYLWPASSATTFPFRVRGTQVQVYSNTIAPGHELADALVYRLPAAQTIGANAIGSQSKPFVTDQNGYLQGRGKLEKRDRLIALLPITTTESYTLYHTSATPTLTGLDAYTVITAGVQQLAVSADNPLILFNLDVSLEWDARNDDAYLSQLENDLKRTSQLLYDWTNGQVALGNIRVFHDKENWLESDILIHASNNFRPNADLGGVATEPMDEQILSISNTQTITDAYLPGQVRMSATWNRFGNPSGDLGVDWPRTLAHELGHYLFFLPDNYFGSDNGRLIQVDCQGSAMNDPYREDYSEFLITDQWANPTNNECLKTVAQKTTGRADWETITNFYPMLNAPQTVQNLNEGPNNLPLEVINVTFMQPKTEANTLADPLFYITDENSNSLALPFGQAQGYLFKTQGTDELTDDLVVAVGSPIVDLLLARGAELGDRFCVFDYSYTPRRLGCLPDIGQGSTALQLNELPGWQPEITVNPITSHTLAITVTQKISSNQELHVQVLPAYPPTTTVATTSPVAVMASIGQENTFVQTINLDYPISHGFVRVSVPDSTPLREEISEFFISDGWGPGGKRPDLFVPLVPLAPIISNDGRVSVLDPNNILSDLPPYALQSLQHPPNLPSWLTPVGETYRFLAANPLTRTENILFRYQQRVLPDESYEDNLQIYYYNPNESAPSWQSLDTKLDTHHNVASALMPEQENGIYALISTIEMPAFELGWNIFGYPLVQTQTVTTALASIEESYTSLYHYDPSSESWSLHDQTVVRTHPEFSGLVNDLTHLEFGESYYISTTKPITWYLGIPATGSREPIDVEGLELPPATYYGWVTPSDSFTVDMTVTAWVGETMCGQTKIERWQGQLAYKLQVKNNSECNVEDSEIVFKVDGHVLGRRPWDNSQAQFYQLPTDPTALTLSSVAVPATRVAPSLLWMSGLLLLTVAGGLLYRRRRE